MVKPSRVPYVRTHKLPVTKGLNAVKERMLRATHAEYQRLVKFYSGVLIAHGGIFDLTQQRRQAALENLTVRTPARPVPQDLDVHHHFPSAPVRFRGAAIHAALAAVEPYLKRVEAYREQQALLAAGGNVPRKERLKEPQVPHVGQHAVLYEGVHVLDPQHFQPGRHGGGFLRVKLLDPSTGSWNWVNVPVNTRPEFHALLSAASMEDERIRAERERIKAEAARAGRVPRKGHRLALTPEEKTRVRRRDGVLEAQSPSLVITKKGISFCVPFKGYATVTRTREGLAAGLHRRVMSVDLNERNVAVAVWNGKQAVKVVKHSYAHLEMRRERALETIIKKQRQSATRPAGEAHCGTRWEYVGTWVTRSPTSSAGT